MKMVTFPKLRKLALAALCASGLSANAQLSGSIDQYINTGYENIAVEFKMSDVASALGSDTATVRTTLDSFMVKGASDACTFYLVQPDGTRSTNYTQGSNGGFWVGLDGTAMSWGPGCVWFNYLSYATGTDVDQFNIVFGQYPRGISNDTIIKPQFVLSVGGKEATFDITYNVKAVPAVQEPTTVLRSAINVVGTASAKATRYTNQGYDATTLGIPAADVIEKLGVDKSIFGAQLSSMLYAEWLDTSDNTIKDSLTNTSTANTPGWWLQRSVYPQGHELQGEASPDVASASYGASCHIYLQGFAYDEASDTITCDLGQYPGTPVAGDSVSANIYIINGDKVYKLNYIVTFAEAETIGLADMENVGNTDIDITIYDEEQNYSAHNASIDVEAIASALGCATSALNMTVLKDENSLYVGTGTANNGGFWVTEEGYACTWGSSAASFFEPTTSGDYSSMNFGLYEGLQKNIGTIYKGKIYFTYESKYYTVSYNLTVAHKELAVKQPDWKVVNKYAAPVQVITYAEGIYVTEQNKYTLAAEQISSDLGTSTFEMYGELADSLVTDSTLYGKHSSYACTPSPGIWFNKDGKASGWNGTQNVGVCWSESDGTFTIYQMPGTTATGTTWSGNIYFVDEETGKMVQVAMTVSFVDELKSSENVGTESLVIEVKQGGETNTAIDLTKPATALGVTVDELLGGYYAKGMNASGIYGAGVKINEAYLYFDTQGNNVEQGVMSLYIIPGGVTGYQVNMWGDEDFEVAEDFKATGKFAFEVGEKIYEYNMTFCSSAVYAGISDVKANKGGKDDKVYDLSGRLVKNPAKGLYIKDGKKLVIK